MAVGACCLSDRLAKADIFSAAIKNAAIAFKAIGHALDNHDQRIVQTSILEMVTQHVEGGDLFAFLDRTHSQEKQEGHSTPAKLPFRAGNSPNALPERCRQDRQRTLRED